MIDIVEDGVIQIEVVVGVVVVKSFVYYQLFHHESSSNTLRPNFLIFV